MYLTFVFTHKQARTHLYYTDTEKTKVIGLVPTFRSTAAWVVLAYDIWAGLLTLSQFN